MRMSKFRTYRRRSVGDIERASPERMSPKRSSGTSRADVSPKRFPPGFFMLARRRSPLAFRISPSGSPQRRRKKAGGGPALAVIGGEGAARSGCAGSSGDRRPRSTMIHCWGNERPEIRMSGRLRRDAIGSNGQPAAVPTGAAAIAVSIIALRSDIGNILAIDARMGTFFSKSGAAMRDDIFDSAGNGFERAFCPKHFG